MRIRWRGLELPSKVTCDQDTLTGTYGKFVVVPFEKGFGHTVGNSLRRVLLSSLEGSAVTSIKVKDALHEFTSLKGVLEDVTEIVLNVKSLVVRLREDRPKVLRLSKKTKGVLTSDDITPDSSVDIISKNHHIATLTDDVPFELEMVVENGRGYIPASEQLAQAHERGGEIGVIPVDAAFSPVTRVQYDVDETRVGQKTNYDKLTIQIWTDGSVAPDIALVEGAKIFRKHLNPFIQYDRLDQFIFAKAKTSSGVTIDPIVESRLVLDIAELGLKERAVNCFKENNVKTVRDLVQLSEDTLRDFRNIGETSLNEVKEKLSTLGLRLGMRL
ncbi:MAG: DNA-directed RNA polymerase subunit alpha [Planctomycetaceae bacterium]|jgi:DNA-directed RNA polymerase subunit alpha|nr:DNA-directed RNA polymerase subunit alpha [Planctomycetaceae bacterium]